LQPRLADPEQSASAAPITHERLRNQVGLFALEVRKAQDLNL
jgi:hypothetical protein